MDSYSFSLAAVAKNLEASSSKPGSSLTSTLTNGISQSKSSDVHVFNLKKHPSTSDSGKPCGIFDLPLFGEDIDDVGGISLSELADAFQANMKQCDGVSSGLSGNFEGVFDLAAFSTDTGEDGDDGISLSDLADAFQAQLSQKHQKVAEISQGGSTDTDINLSSDDQPSLTDKNQNSEKQFKFDFGLKSDKLNHNSNINFNKQLQINSKEIFGQSEALVKNKEQAPMNESANKIADISVNIPNFDKPVTAIDLTTLIGSRRRTESDRMKPEISVGQLNSATDCVTNKFEKSCVIVKDSEHVGVDSLLTDIKIDNSESDFRMDSRLSSKNLPDMQNLKIAPGSNSLFSNILSTNAMASRITQSSSKPATNVTDICISVGKPSGLGLAFHRPANILGKDLGISGKDEEHQQIISLFCFGQQSSKMCSVRPAPHDGVRRIGDIKKMRYEISEFDFSTPSPDDIVRSSQKKAFN